MFEALAGFVQQLPASEAHHHAGPGGLLSHALEVVLEAMKLRRGALLPPGASAEELARLQDVWTYACVSAALLHDIGKPLADQRITLFGADHAPLGQWKPTDGPMGPPARYYRVEFVARRRYRRHERLTPLLAGHIVPAEGLRWLAGEPEAMDAWLAALQGDYDEAGPLGAIVSRADGLSVARDLSGGDRVRMPAARSKPLADRLITALRHLLAQEELPLNRRGAAGFLAGEELWLVSKRVLDAIKEHLAREGQTGIPSRNDRLMDELQQHGLLIPNDEQAIWPCEVRIGDWTQRLTMLRLEASTVWPDPDRRPAPLEGSVTPVDDGDGADVPDSAHGGEPTEATAATAAAGRYRQELAQEADFNNLPLPYDLSVAETPVKVASAPSEGIHPSPDTSLVDDSATGDDRTADEDDDLGRRFVAWLKENIVSGRVEINTARARIHVLQDGLALISPGIFRDFDAARWDKAQKRFQKLKLHLKRPDGTNIWTCRVAKERKQSRIKVMLIPEPEKTLGVTLPPPNPAVTLLTEDGGNSNSKEAANGQAV
jgi:integrating conjugative element relaxase (TIGR03760 family)